MATNVEGITAPHRTDLPHRKAEWLPITIFIYADRAELDDQPLTVEALAAKQERAHAKHVYLLADGAARWRDIVTVTKLVGDQGLHDVVFVFERDATDHAPVHTHVDDDLKEIAKDKSATKLAKYAAKLVGSCPAMKKVFSSVAAENQDPAKNLVDGAGPAVAECGCEVDPDDIASLMWGIMRREHPADFLPVTIDPSGPTIRADPAATWATVSTQLTPQTTHANLVVN
ncbi:MAG TPA: hypothetical protein VGM88_31960 [Kofleriaceae bacterium]